MALRTPPVHFMPQPLSIAEAVRHLLKYTGMVNGAVPLPLLIAIAHDLLDQLKVIPGTEVTREGDTWSYTTPGGNVVVGRFVSGVDPYGTPYQRLDFSVDPDD